MPSRKIVITIVSHGQEDLVLSLLNTLNNLVHDTDFEVILIDNLSPEIQLPRDKYFFPISRHKNQSPLGFAENVNKAFALKGTDADYFCILNPDVEIPASVFPILLNRMEESSIDVISPIVLDHEGRIQDSFRPIPTPLEIIKRRLFPTPSQIDPDDLPEIIYPDWIAGLFMLMKSSVFKEIGGFNQSYQLYFEDVEFCLKVRLLGFEIAVLKEVSVLHDAQWQSRKKIRYLLYHIASALRFFSSEPYRSYRKSPTFKKRV